MINKFPDAKLTICGKGSQRDYLMRMVDDFGLSDNVVFLNGVDYTTTITMNGEPVEGAIVSLYQNDIAYFSNTATAPFICTHIIYCI